MNFLPRFSREKNQPWKIGCDLPPRIFPIEQQLITAILLLARGFFIHLEVILRFGKKKERDTMLLCDFQICKIGSPPMSFISLLSNRLVKIWDTSLIALQFDLLFHMQVSSHERVQIAPSVFSLVYRAIDNVEFPCKFVLLFFFYFEGSIRKNRDRGKLSSSIIKSSSRRRAKMNFPNA